MSIRTVEGAFEMTCTVDCTVFGFADNELKVLLVRRVIEAFDGYWLLPGGVVHSDETLEMAAENVLRELTGAEDVYMEQVNTYSAIDRHPIKRVMTVGFYALVNPNRLQVEPKTNVFEVRWCPVQEVPELGFDHNQILEDAYDKLKRELLYRPLVFELLPPKFTLKELQDLYEVILNEPLDRRNFRRKLASLDILVDTKEKKSGVRGGPNLYKFNRSKFPNHNSVSRNAIV